MQTQPEKSSKPSDVDLEDPAQQEQDDFDAAMAKLTPEQKLGLVDAMMKLPAAGKDQAKV